MKLRWSSPGTIAAVVLVIAAAVLAYYSFHTTSEMQQPEHASVHEPLQNGK